LPSSIVFSASFTNAAISSFGKVLNRFSKGFVKNKLGLIPFSNIVLAIAKFKPFLFANLPPS